MSRLKDGQYISIQAFMVRDLHLKGNELVVYGLIYGFTQAESQKYSGSLQYIEEWVSSTKQGVLKTLKSLIDKGLIAKRENYINGVKFCEYYATEFTPGKLSTTGCQLWDTDESAEFTEGGKQSLPNNIDRNYSNNKEKNSFGKPTLEEVKAYCLERKNSVDPQRFIDYYSANGWRVGKNPMKDWKAAVRTWERNEQKDTSKRFDNERKYGDDFFAKLEGRSK